MSKVHLHIHAYEMYMRMSQGSSLLGVGEMVQWVKCPPCKHRDLSSDPQHACRSQCSSVTPAWDWGRFGDAWIPRVH